MLDMMTRTWRDWTEAHEGLLRLVPLALVVAALVSAPQPHSVIAGRFTSDMAKAGSIHIDPASAAIEVGDAVTVDVVLSDGAGYYGLELDLSFDPGVVSVPSAQVEPVWEVFDAEHHWTVRNDVDKVSGTVHYAVTNLHPAEPFTGTGRVCRITFTGMEPGRTALKLTKAAGATRDGEPLEPATVDGEIVVAGGPTPPVGPPVGGATVTCSLSGAVVPWVTLAVLVVLGAMTTVLWRGLRAPE